MGFDLLFREATLLAAYEVLKAIDNVSSYYEKYKNCPEPITFKCSNQTVNDFTGHALDTQEACEYFDVLQPSCEMLSELQHDFEERFWQPLPYCELGHSIEI